MTPVQPTGTTPAEQERCCQRCGENEATVRWGDALAVTHGFFQMICERCAVEQQVPHARERAEALPGLEARLAELGGPAAAVCDCRRWYVQGGPPHVCPVHGKQELP